MKKTIKEDYRRSLYWIHILGQVMISVLIFYYMWYNEKYNHSTIIVYGSFLIMLGCIVLDMFSSVTLDTESINIGIWINFVMVAYALITGFFVAYNQSYLLENVRLVLQYSIIAFGVYYFANKSEHGIDWIIITINIATLVCCYFLIAHPYKIYGGRYSLSPRNNPNTLGVILVMGIFSVLYNLKPSFKRVMIILPQIGAMLYGIIMTGSRKSLLAGLLIVFLSILQILKELHRTLTTAQYLFIVIIFFTIILFSARYLIQFYFDSGISSRIDEMYEDESNLGRIRLYIAAWNIFLEKPLFGGGLQQFRFWSGYGCYAHSTYAEAIADFGFIGCIIYFFPILKSVYVGCVNAFSRNGSYKNRLIFILITAELFIGVGQIFFLDIVHYLAWTIIFYVISHPYINGPHEPIEKSIGYKYIK